MSTTDRAPSPTPSERARLDEDAKAKEDAEQAALPYKWTQTIKDADVTVPVPGNIRGKDLDIVLTKNRIKVAIKGGEVFIDVSSSLGLGIYTSTVLGGWGWWLT